MLETLSVVPVSFWVVVALLAVGAGWAATQIRNGVGLPMLAVLGTVAAWYVGDALYNDYVGDYMREFTTATLAHAWWQVAWFLTVFLILAPVSHNAANARHLARGSQVYRMLQTGAGQPIFQFRLNQLFWVCATVWTVLSILAAIRLGIATPYYFFPLLGHGADPWSRGRIGGGIDALLSLAGYLEMFAAATFGVIAALAQDRRVRLLALLGCLLTWPHFLFGWARNVMLAVTIPAVLAWVFLRLRGGKGLKMVALAAAFLLVNAWFGFVIANRSTTSLISAFEDNRLTIGKDSDVHHAGLNMFEELCWVNHFIKDGSYKPNWGQEYLAELANPIPRTLWPGKPLLNIGYSELRGESYNNGQAGVGATISTGMIGQGVINFGGIPGPAAAALLMALWAAGLARLDLEGQKIGRIPLYALGLILTFNLGRDITFITLYTFVFGSAIVLWLEWREKHHRLVPAAGGKMANRTRRSRKGRKGERGLPEPSPFAVTSPVLVENKSSSKPQS